MSNVSAELPAYMARLAPVISDVVVPAAAEVDRTGTYPVSYTHLTLPTICSV